MCAQGSSGGSAAIGYSLIWYGAAGYVNNVELMSGPVFSDVEMGCAIPAANNANICANNQYGCSSGTLTEVQQNAWVDRPLYLVGWRPAVVGFTNDPTCNAGQTTSSQSNANWKQQSILNGTTQGALNLHTVGMGAWLCYSSMPFTCNRNQGCPNNSAAEGQQLYQLFTSQSNSPIAYKLTGIQQCTGAEGVAQGTDPDDQNSGQTDIEAHMRANCKQGQ